MVSIFHTRDQQRLVSLQLNAFPEIEKQKRRQTLGFTGVSLKMTFPHLVPSPTVHNEASGVEAVRVVFKSRRSYDPV